MIVERELVAVCHGKGVLGSFFSRLRVLRVYGCSYTVTQLPIESLVIIELSKKRRVEMAPEQFNEVYWGGNWGKMERARIVCRVAVMVEECLRERSFRVFAEEGEIIRWRILVGEGEVTFGPVQRDGGWDGVHILALMISEARYEKETGRG